MNNDTWLENRFEDNRTHLRSVAYRILGSSADADDAVQEAWIRLQRADTSSLDNIGGWLTTVVSRVCLDMLRSRRAHPEEPIPLDTSHAAQDPDPEYEAMISETVGFALLVVMDTLTPAERLAFVLHDMFAVPFNDIAAVLDCTPDAARQHASRARRRVQGATESRGSSAGRDRAIVDAFLAASREGEFDALVSMLHPDAALHADVIAQRAGVDEVVGAHSVAEIFAGRAKAAELALIDGHPGAVWRQRGTPRAAFRFTIVESRVTDISLVMDPQTIDNLHIVVPK